MNEIHSLSPLVIGRTVARIRRVLYVFKGEILTEHGGPLELTFEDSGTVLLSVDPDGERLAVTTSTWTDLFAPPLSPENREYVARFGKRTAFDMSPESEFSVIIGTAATQVAEVRSQWHVVVGVELTYPRAVLRAVVAADELIADVVELGPLPPT